MRRHLRIASVLGTSCSLAMAYACFGEDPNTSATPTSDSGGPNTSDGSPSGADGASGDIDSTVAEEPLVCDAPTVACGKTCVTLATSKDHCGRCNHGCGGGECQQGSCKTVDVATNIQELRGVSVSNGYVYFSTNNADQSTAALQRCAVTGCAPKETLFNSQILGSGISTVTASEGLVTFTYTRTSASAIVQVCPETGCLDGGSTGISGSNSHVFAVAGKKFFISGGKFSSSVSVRDCSATPCAFTGFGPGHESGGAGDDTHVIFARDNDDGGTDLALCDLPSACDGGGLSLTTTLPDEGTIHAGVYYTLKSGLSGQPTGHLGKCTLPCNGGPVNFVGPLNYPTELLVDATGIYWMASNLDQILTCPLTGCPNTGGAIVVEGLGPGAKYLRADQNFIYWVVDGDVAERYDIVRIAKP